VNNKGIELKSGKTAQFTVSSNGYGCHRTSGSFTKLHYVKSVVELDEDK
jgi:hypothetical protein